MVHLELSPEEALILHRILASCESELRIEVAATDVRGFTEVLEREEEFIRKMLAQLEAAGLPLPEALAGNYE